MHLLILIVAFLAVDQAHGEIGKVTEQLNAVPSITRKTGTLNAPKGTGIETLDAVKTAAGKLAMTFEDETKVQMTENSKLVIDDFVYDPNNKSGGKLAVKVALGTMRYASGQIAKSNPQNVLVNTPTATIGVRGTDFSATVDELGGSTVVLLPSCPNNKPTRTVQDIEANCVTGTIFVETDAGQVVLNQPFQATKVDSRDSKPRPPVILKLSEDAMNNMLIIAPPKEFGEQKTVAKVEAKGALDVDFLKEQGLVNVLDKQQAELFQDSLSRNFLDTDFLANILDIINAQLAAQLDLLNNTKSGLLPDYNAVTGIVATVDDLRVELCRDDGSNVQCVSTPKTQNSTIYQTQGMLEFKNRVNTGAGTTITLIQK